MKPRPLEHVAVPRNKQDKIAKEVRAMGETQTIGVL